MKKGVALFAMFTLGAVFGSGVTFLYADKKLKANYEKEVEKEIQSVKEGFNRMQKELYEKNVLEKNRIMDDYKKGLSSFGYVDEVVGKEENDADISQEEEEPENLIKQLPKVHEEPVVNDPPVKDIYLITAEQYGEFEDYKTEDLTFYKEGSVTDAYGDQVQNPEELLGEELMDILPTYLDSGFTETYVRNERLKTDYEVDFADYDFLYE